MTNGEIDRLGERLRLSQGHPKEDDLALLQEYRKTFQEPVARVFNAVLKRARRIDNKAIVTFRIKRIDTIVEKLIRNQKNANGPMQLSRMWDIAGCRCIINTVEDDKLYALLTEIKEEFGKDSKVNDHIRPPKEDGYRSLHIYVKDVVSSKRIEIQIRSRKQHNWATLVEIVDLIYGSQYKEIGHNGTLGRFLYLYSNAEILSDNEFSEMLKVERDNKVFERMSETISKNYLSIRRQWLKNRSNGSYFVITANKRTGSTIDSYSSFERAESAYYNKYLERRDSNIVLTHIPSSDFNQISIAYSNYILAMHAFFDDYRRLVSKKIIECVKTDSYRQFFRDFSIYVKNIKCYFNNLTNEINEIAKCFGDTDISRNQINKWKKEVKERLLMWAEETRLFFSSLYAASNGKPIYRMIIKNRLKRFAKLVTQ